MAVSDFCNMLCRELFIGVGLNDWETIQSDAEKRRVLRKRDRDHIFKYLETAY